MVKRRVQGYPNGMDVVGPKAVAVAQTCSAGRMGTGPRQDRAPPILVQRIPGLIH